MNRAVAVGIFVVVVGGASAGGYLLARHNAPVSSRAMEAYQAGRYAEAVPLLKEWAKTMTVKKDGPEMGKVLTYLADAEARSTGKPVVTAETGGDAGPIGLTQGSSSTTAPGAAVAAAPVASDGPVIIDPSTNKQRVPHAAPVPGEVLTMSIKELGNFEFDPNGNSPIPADVQALDGAKIRLRGFMIPMNQAESITDFSLVPSLVGCCFGQPPGVQHTITCTTQKGMAIGYTVDEIVVEGTLKLDLKRDQGYAYNVFDLIVTSALKRLGKCGEWRGESQELTARQVNTSYTESSSQQ